ncbi:MAG: glycoside hydrolase family 127 protein, partial [Chloroflexota bacterium]|nr:glycoside hydrolase family 127 protein [Chloroflexota bacterium]
GEQALFEALTQLWHDMTTRKMHITGGFGARFVGESFGEAYELPSDRCYCETCASIASMMWNWRMLLATGEPRYADVLERSLYNGFLSGVSLDGRRYFYINPLQSRGGIERAEWYSCACCPPNVMRQIAAVGHYMATANETGVQIHQYASARIEAELKTGQHVVLRVETDYPWDGRVKVTVEETNGAAWQLMLRVPGWCEGASLQVNDRAVEQPSPGGIYAAVERDWQAGDVIELDLPIVPRLTAPNPRIDAIRGSLAIERGPLVYCLEQIDQEPDLDLLDVRIASEASLQAARHKDLLGGVVTIEAQGAGVDIGAWQDELYRSAPVKDLPQREVTLTAVPYYAWANRGPGTMRVWIPQ